MKRIALLLLVSFLISQDSYIDSLKIKNPSLAWKISLVPGMGQIYNEQYLKGIFLMGLEAKLINDFSNNFIKYNISKRNDLAWLIFGLYVYSLLDAYVEAHLSSFPTKKNNISKEKK